MGDRVDQWYPIAAASDLPFRHIFQTELLGQEMVAWRADDGFVNIWQNRCLHRGSRLSIGVNDGAELVCAYHGWRYANRTAGCTYIPAHPSDSPPRTVCNRVYPAVERHGLVWTGLSPQGDPPEFEDLSEEGLLVLRSRPIHAPLEDVARLFQDYDFDMFHDKAQEALRFGLASHSGDRFRFCSLEPAETISLLLMMQPVNSAKTIVHGVVAPSPEEVHRLDALHYYDHQLTRFCEKVDAGIPPRTHVGPEDFL